MRVLIYITEEDTRAGERVHLEKLEHVDVRKAVDDLYESDVYLLIGPLTDVILTELYHKEFTLIIPEFENDELEGYDPYTRGILNRDIDVSAFKNIRFAKKKEDIINE